MSKALLDDLGAPAPDVLLDVGSGSPATQTARVRERFEPVLLQHRPAWVVVVGDVNSTLACALVAAKLRAEIGCRIAHVEAGLRSHDWSMPEEVNRVLTDRLSDLLLTPSDDAEENLLHEGMESTRTEFVGNVMIDSLLDVPPKARALDMPGRLAVHNGSYALATLHRPSNVDDPELLALLLGARARVAEERPVVFPMHPRTAERACEANAVPLLKRSIVTEPLGYAEMAGMQDGAAAVITDSGGLQEETTVLGVPCITVRAQTERPITVNQGTNRIVEWPLSIDGVMSDVRDVIAKGRLPVGGVAPAGWDGRAAARIVRALCDGAPPTCLDRRAIAGSAK